MIVLIDEYDVPLAKAFENGYYDQMVFLIRNLLEQVLKTNNSLKFAVMTGCMRISKESIFTGLNNLKVLYITKFSRKALALAMGYKALLFAFPHFSCIMYQRIV